MHPTDSWSSSHRIKVHFEVQKFCGFAGEGGDWSLVPPPLGLGLSGKSGKIVQCGNSCGPAPGVCDGDVVRHQPVGRGGDMSWVPLRSVGAQDMFKGGQHVYCIVLY